MPIAEEIHTATVTANDDPLKRGRIRCSCVGLLADEDGELPMFIEPELQWGWFLVPDVGEIVEIVATVQGDTDDSFGQTSLENPNIRWRGVRHWSDDVDGDSPRPVPEDFKTNYGKRRGFATPRGHILMFDDTEGKEKITLTHKSTKDGQDAFAFYSLDEDGSVVISNRNGSIIYLNAKNQQIAIVDEFGNSITMDEDGIRSIDKFGNIIEMKDGVVQVLSQGNIIMNGSNFSAEAASVDLVKGADDNLVRFSDLKLWLETHIHSTSMGPSGIPVFIPPSAIVPIPPPGVIGGFGTPNAKVK